MIGVIARAEDHEVVHEFFELFKTPWEFYREDRRYDVVIDAGATSNHHSARFVIGYGSHATSLDHHLGNVPDPEQHGAMLSYDGDLIPIYGRCATLPTEDSSPRLVIEGSRESVLSVTRTEGRVLVRIGYDLFREIDHLLTAGQPSAHAGIPALERHIAVLRDCIVDADIPLVEIPPVPAGYRFIVCLTHDIDHPSIRRHKFDHTLAGFLYRAVFGSFVRVCTGRAGLKTLGRNLGAVLRLPFVHLGWARDFWSGFDEYLAFEKGLRSTFFVIPEPNQSGRTPAGQAPRRRAAAYGASDIGPKLNVLLSAGCEVGLHGIDAWRDSACGFEEREEISRVTGTPTAGVRMHWLFWDDRAPERLEQAGFTYDSTFGYNDTVGYRAGTLQAFKPVTAKHLLELPLTIMDTALFYPSYLNLTPEAAGRVVRPLVAAAERYGGALTINWHDRSLAPERLWGGFYRELLDDLRRRQAWFPTAAQATSWFRQRRAARFDSVSRGAESVHVAASADSRDDLPGLTIRVHAPRSMNGGGQALAQRSDRFIDVPLTHKVDTHVRI